jgi:KaiC/GvpD/RAD55 family RecA-like ATPase
MLETIVEDDNEKGRGRLDVDMIVAFWLNASAMREIVIKRVHKIH